MRLLFSLVVVLPLFLPAKPGDNGYNIKAHYTKYEFRIPMRDGKRLFTAVYVPKDTSKTYPFLIMRTPYGIAPYGVDNYSKTLYPGDNFARDGYIFVYQDVRGRYMSEGTWLEMTPEKDHHSSPSEVDESTDTYDTIEWLLHHVPGNNGKAGLLGISYPGFYTSAGLIDAHPALVAASPQAPIADLYMGDDAFHNGAFFLAANFGFYSSFQKQDHPQKPKHSPAFDFGTKDGYKFYMNLGSVQNADEKYFNYKNPYWTDMIAHPNYDEFWKARNILPHLRNIKPAVLVVGGWYDAEDLSGTLKTYRAIKENSPSTTDLIVMGPWSHGGWERGEGARLGDISFRSNTSEFFRDQIQLPFFHHYLKDTGDPQLPKAYMFETGTMQWRRFSKWPPANAKSEKLYLHAGGALSFKEPSANENYDQYVSNPNKPVPYYNKVVTGMAREYMDADQRFAAHRTDVLTYETEPLEEDITIAGPVSPTLHVSTSGTDSDFIVKLIDVYPEDYPNPDPNPSKVEMGGYEQLVRGEPFRGKFRHSFEKPEPFTPGKVEEIHFSMPDIDHCFRRGHRIMVQIQSSWFPLVDRNPQEFTTIPTANPANFKAATERIYHSEAAPSFLSLEILR